MFFFLFFLVWTTSCYANLIRDTELETKLEALIAPMLEEAEITPKVKVRVALNSSFNAFVTGDNTIYVHSGLLLDAETLEEVVGVLAHELGHIASGHVARKAESINKASNITMLSTILATAAAIGGSGDIAASVLVGGSDRAARQFYYSSRTNEAVADEWALKILDKLEISTNGMARMMQRLSQENALPESHQSEYYLTHPGTKQRLAVYEDHLQHSGLKNAQMSDADYAGFRRIVAKLSAYQARPQLTIQALTGEALTIDERYKRAIAFFRYGDLTSAMQDIQILLSEEPENPYFYELAGETAFADRNLTSAIIYFDAAFEKSNQAPLIGLRLGRILLATGTAENYKRAAKILRIAVIGEPEWSFVRREYAIALGKTGDIARASWQLAEAAFLSGDLQQASSQLSRALAQKDLTAELKKQLLDLKFLIETKKSREKK